mgnify:CR=1 FL=1
MLERYVHLPGRLLSFLPLANLTMPASWPRHGPRIPSPGTSETRAGTQWARHPPPSPATHHRGPRARHRRARPRRRLRPRRRSDAVIVMQCGQLPEALPILARDASRCRAHPASGSRPARRQDEPGPTGCSRPLPPRSRRGAPSRSCFRADHAGSRAPAARLGGAREAGPAGRLTPGLPDSVAGGWPRERPGIPRGSGSVRERRRRPQSTRICATLEGAPSQRPGGIPYPRTSPRHPMSRRTLGLPVESE